MDGLAGGGVATARAMSAGWASSPGPLGHGPLADVLADAPLLEIGAAEPDVAHASQATVVAAYRLQDIADYRAALQAWFGAVRAGGHLVIVVPHAFLRDRQLGLPSRWNPAQRRLYTPASLMAEVEEALTPNSYRVRHLQDDDRGYDYAGSPEQEPTGRSDVILALQKIDVPAWPLDALVAARAPAPDYGFEPSRTRIEIRTHPPRGRILILKLDHMGDFIMGITALERARTLFAGAEITLVVGSWNLQIARELGLADHVIAFDAFPRNSSEWEVDVRGKTALFDELITENYDLAIDLRTDTDTRVLLERVRAGLRAGIGTAARFPFLDIFLPLDFNRNQVEMAEDLRYSHHDFISQGPVTRGEYRLHSRADTVERHCAIIWGPYRPLRAGRFYFEPYLEIDPAADGMLVLDIGLDTARVAYATLPSRERVRLAFTVDKDEAEFEFRIWTMEGMPSIDFDFFGGRLIRAGAGSTLHQSEYGTLLIELVALRLARTGLLADIERA